MLASGNGKGRGEGAQLQNNDGNEQGHIHEHGNRRDGWLPEADITTPPPGIHACIRPDEERHGWDCEEHVEEGDLDALHATPPVGIGLVGPAKGDNGAAVDGDVDGGHAKSAAWRGPVCVAEDAASGDEQVPDKDDPAEGEEDLVLPDPPAGVDGLVYAGDGDAADNGVCEAEEGDQRHAELEGALALELALFTLFRVLVEDRVCGGSVAGGKGAARAMGARRRHDERCEAEADGDDREVRRRGWGVE